MVTGSPQRVAVYGGDLRRLVRALTDLADVALFGRTGQTGQGELRRLLAALRAGGVREVCVIVRWAGHGEVDAIRRLCRRLRVPCRDFLSIGAVRRCLSCDS